MSELNGEFVEIPPQKSTTILLIKVCLLTVFLIGVLMRIFVPLDGFTQLADVLIMLAVLGRLFMYVRHLNPSQFFPTHENSSPLSLIEKKETVVSTYDKRTRTPLERVLSDK